MGGGSALSADRSSPQSPTDQQCTHCGRYFSQRGIDSHEANCDFEEFDVVLVPIAGQDDEGETPSGDGTDPSATAPDDVGTSPSPDVAADTAGGTQGTRTDGGPRAPPTPDVEDVDDVQDEHDEDDGCPACGSEEWFDPADLPDAVLDERPDLAEYDRACYPCSTDEQGEMTRTIEVYDI